LAEIRVQSVGSTLLKSAIAVGISDFFFASVSNWFMQHRTPVRVFQGVASVPFGKGMIDRGIGAALIGLLLHFCVAFIWSTVYYLITRSSSVAKNLVRTPQGAVVFALLYGPFIWLFMSLVLIPAFVHRAPTFTPIWWVQLVGHALFVVGPMIWAFGDGRGEGPSALGHRPSAT
jgi:hypothetical protein